MQGTHLNVLLYLIKRCLCNTMFTRESDQCFQRQSTAQINIFKITFSLGPFQEKIIIGDFKGIKVRYYQHFSNESTKFDKHILYMFVLGVHFREVYVLERCPSQRDVHLRGAHLREVSILERCPSQRGVYVREVSILKRCSSQRDIHCKEVSILEKCPSQRGVDLREISILERCPPQRGIYLRDVYLRCPSQRGIHLRSVRLTDVYLREISQRCPFQRGVHLKKVSK